jgi:hypothetical protein
MLHNFLIKLLARCSLQLRLDGPPERFGVVIFWKSLVQTRNTLSFANQVHKMIQVPETIYSKVATIYLFITVVVRSFAQRLVFSRILESTRVPQAAGSKLMVATKKSILRLSDALNPNLIRFSVSSSKILHN